MPKITIITISYNNKAGLEKTLASVTSQSHQDFEYIVIDGGSQDGSKEILEQYSDKISYWVSEPDKGIYNALNKGIKVANGDYLFFLNAGDLFIDQNSLTKAAIHLTNEDIIYFDIKVIGEKVEFVKECPKKLDFYFLYRDTLPHQATFMKKNTFEIVGMYDESLKIVSDWKWYTHALFTYKLTYKKVNETFSIFFLDGISSNNNELLFKERTEVLKEFPEDLLDLCKIIDDKEKEIKHFKIFEYKYQFLTKYRIIKLLNRLGVITIR